MQIKTLIVWGLALIGLLSFGCVRKTDTSLGEIKLTIPTYTVSAPAKGKILGLIIEKNEHIGKGQPLFAIASDDVDNKVKNAAEELAKAEAELKRLEIGSSAQVNQSDLTSAKENLSKAEAKVEKMSRLLAEGAVSKKQASMAEAELAVAKANYQAMSGQTERQKASPEAIAKQKETIEALKQVNSKVLAEQAAYEAISPNAGIVIEKFANSGDVVEKNQTVLKLLAQDECEITIELSNNAVKKLDSKQTALVFKEKGSGLAFSGKIVKLEGNTLRVLVKLPTSIKQGASLQLYVQE